MTTKGIVNQLEDLRSHCAEMADGDDFSDVWDRDVEALTYAINKIKEEIKYE